MTSSRPLAVFAFTHPWMQEMVLKVAPDEFEVKFLDPKNEAEMRALLPLADFLMINELPAERVALLKRCKLVQHQGVGYDGIDVAALAQAGIPLAGWGHCSFSCLISAYFTGQANVGQEVKRDTVKPQPMIRET